MLEVGKLAPDFTLESSTGKTVSLSDFKGSGVVLYFYPKDNTPGCTTEACDFRNQKERFDAKGIVILGVSKDSAKSHQSFINKHSLNFTLLSDPDGKVCQDYGAWGKKPTGKEGILRTTVIIDRKGKVVEIYPRVKVKGHVEEVLANV